jgi:hypothetical protein
MNPADTTTANIYPNAPDIVAEDYVVLGLANCFIKADGEIHQVQVVEPIPSAALEAIVKGIPTSYECAYATTIGAVLVGEELVLPGTFPANAQFCDDFAYRATSAARTYKTRTIAQEYISLGSTKNDFNFSTERKRVLNSERIIKNEDNVKQHAYTHQNL